MKSHLLFPRILIAGFLTLIPLTGFSGPGRENSFTANLNGLELTFDADTGGLLRLSYPGVGNILEATRERSGLVDLAYPVKEFEPLRLATRFSHGAKINVSSNAVEIHYEKLGVSRSRFEMKENVSATVRFAAAPDGRSVILSCKVQNQSTNNVRQILFPDLMGLRPVGNAKETFFRTSLFATRPFVDLAPNEDKLITQYMTDFASFSAEYTSGGLATANGMGLRWMDYGSLQGGFGLFTPKWGFDPPLTVRLHLSEVDDRLRLLGRNDITLTNGEKWESGEYWLTPHTGGWAAGIEPFRKWVKQNYKRAMPMPKHVRDGIGYRTVWMAQQQPVDAQDVLFTVKDLPALAKDCAAHGIDEMVLWGWHKYFELPLPGPQTILGTEEEFTNAVQVCRKLGVNVSPFISIYQVNSVSASRYGIQGLVNGWTYHTDLVPRWNPPYAAAAAAAAVPVSNKLWHEDVLQSARKLADMGVASLSWDQYWTTTTETPSPNLQDLTRGIRDYAQKHDPESTFSGEQLWNMEIDSGYLDYTWNWGGYRDCRALTSVLPTPRVDAIVSQSALAVKKSFADNLYLNIFPRKKGSINGSDLIEPYPELSKALKQCAKLKKQFLPYFTEGTLIGDCILSSQCKGAHVSAYVSGDKLLMLLINEGEPRKVEFQSNLSSWLTGKKWQVKSFNADGQKISETKLS
ncbi:MAG: hypothetical protein ABJC04_03450, partial [Verrucomicrobiota bacterium]